MKPTLYILAAGMGSRYGGLKQLDGVGPQGQTIMDYSIFDAMRAGFGKVVFVIRRDFEDEFRDRVLSRYEGHIPLDVVFQSLDALPEGFTVPEGREKPWGTNHAVMMADGVIKEPFAVINADDFYGRHAFEVIARFLSDIEPGSKGKYCMVAFHIGNTMTDNGAVSRGVCSVSDDGKLSDVIERKAISYDSDHNISFTDVDGNKIILDPETTVSMNFWGFTPDYFDFSVREFTKFLSKYGDKTTSEFFLPSVVDKLVKNGEAQVDVLNTKSKWFGITYAQDRPVVVANLAALHKAGEYPDQLFS